MASVWAQPFSPGGLSVAFGAPLSGTLVSNFGSSSFAGTMSGIVTFSDNDQETISANFSLVAGGLPGVGTIVASGTSQLVPEDHVWATAGAGSWSASSNWTGGVPNVFGALAILNLPTTAPRVVTLDTPVTLGGLQLGNSANPSAGYVLSGSGVIGIGGGGGNTLTLDNSGIGAIITLTDGKHLISAPVILADNLTVTSGGTSSWTLEFNKSGSITDHGAGYALTMDGDGGTLILGGSNSYNGTTIVEAGILIATTNNAIEGGTNLSVGNDLFAFGTFFSPLSPDATAAGAVPEPSTLALLGIGGLALLCRARRSRAPAKIE
jgi:autotransporter-associated beta strand protein